MLYIPKSFTVLKTPQVHGLGSVCSKVYGLVQQGNLFVRIRPMVHPMVHDVYQIFGQPVVLIFGQHTDARVSIVGLILNQA